MNPSVAMMIAHMTNAPAVAMAITECRGPGSRETVSKTKSSSPLSNAAATGNRALSCQFIRIFAGRAAGGRAGEASTSLPSLDHEEDVGASGSVERSAMSMHYSTTEVVPIYIKITMGAVARPHPGPHAYACKPGSKYVTPRKVKITTANPKIAKYAARRPRQPRVMRIWRYAA